MITHIVHKLIPLSLVIVGVVLIGSTPARAAGKVSLSQSTIDIAEGATATVSVTLDEPIIAPPDTEPNLYLNIVASQSNRVTFSANPVTFLPTEWAQTKTFTITAVDDALHNASNTITLTLTAVTGSEYYKNYTTTLILHLTDNDPEQTPTPAALPTATPLATKKKLATPAPTPSPTTTAAASDQSLAITQPTPTATPELNAVDLPLQTLNNTSRLPLYIAIGGGGSLVLVIATVFARRKWFSRTPTTRPARAKARRLKKSKNERRG
jgi:hypothetical protein